MVPTSPTTVRRLLVANRGEIARRVFATCRRLGIETVAVHSDADAGLPFVAEADHAVRLPGNSPTETYLRGDLVIEAARRAGADAIHPGYGFLSENAGFARAVAEAGLAWVGPEPDSIDRMGSKVEAKKLMDAAGVPILRDLSVEDTTEADLPVLVKASAGGGGRGMRVVRSLDALRDEVAAASAEASSAFGDGTVFIETYVERGRHVEVQVVGHRDGVLVLGERDCSVQRRHQKVVEEAPAPGLPTATREALHEAARKAAEAIGYVGAGTVEFLYDADRDSFYFLEMNTRLQVEHPVTEAVHGVDLVELQLAVVEGFPVGDHVPQPCEPYGHAVEVRLYAENPAADYQPQSGRLVTFEIPGVDAEFGPIGGAGLRLDAGFVSGSEVSTHYDAMLAKLIAWAPTREQATRRLVGALRRARIHGLTTNRDQLVQVLTDPRFTGVEGLSTAMLADGPLLQDERTSVHPGDPLVAAALAVAERDRAGRTVQERIPVGWRNVVSQPQRTTFAPADGPDDPDRHRHVEWYGGRDGYVVDDLVVLAASPGEVRLERDGVATSYAVSIAGDRVDVDSARGHVALRLVPRFVDPAEQLASGSLVAPMPGTVVKVLVAEGAEVEAGQAVLVLEAMKMQHSVSAPTAGTVTAVPVTAGQQVAAGDVLAVVEGEDA